MQVLLAIASDAVHKSGAVNNTWQNYWDRALAEYVKRLETRKN
jgi:hypothetical protein